MTVFRFVKNTGINFQFDFKLKKKQQNIDNLIGITLVTLLGYFKGFFLMLNCTCIRRS